MCFFVFSFTWTSAQVFVILVNESGVQEESLPGLIFTCREPSLEPF
jgi:hypothetical protein